MKATAGASSLHAARLAYALGELDGKRRPMPPAHRGRDPLSPTGAQWFYARWCALECMHLWPCPPLIGNYLESGDPELASMKETETLAQVRSTAAGLAQFYISWWGERRLGFGADGAAATSALYAATGNTAGAAQWAVHALAFAAMESAVVQAGHAFTTRERLEVLNAAKLKLQEVFAAAAAEIIGGDDRL